MGAETPPFRLLERLYADGPMRRIWSEDGSVGSWLRVEAELARAQAAVGLLDAGEAEAVAAACRDDVVDREALWESGRVVGAHRRSSGR